MKLLKSIGIFGVFYASQILSMIIVLVFKMSTDVDYFYELVDVMDTYSVASMEYLNKVMELVYISLILPSKSKMLEVVTYVASCGSPYNSILNTIKPLLYAVVSSVSTKRRTPSCLNFIVLLFLSFVTLSTLLVNSSRHIVGEIR